ncbi:MAG: hypothetical protein ACK528_14610, partial [Alphaproteobacteria bacterium]
MEKNFKKAAVNPFVKSNSGGIILKGMNVGYSTEAPTFNVVIAAGGNSSTFTLNSGNFAQFEFVRYNITDSAGNGNGAVYASGTETLDITNVSKAYNGIGPDASIEIVYKLVGQEQVLSYSINLDSASLVAGITVNTADALNSNARGAYLLIDNVVYQSGASQTVVDVIGAIGLVGYTLEAEVDGNTDTGVVLGDGTVQIIVAGALAAGTYTVT